MDISVRDLCDEQRSIPNPVRTFAEAFHEYREFLSICTCRLWGWGQGSQKCNTALLISQSTKKNFFCLGIKVPRRSAGFVRCTGYVISSTRAE